MLTSLPFTRRDLINVLTNRESLYFPNSFYGSIMSEQNKRSLKRTRQSSGETVDKRSRLAEEKTSSSRLGVVPCPNEKPRAPKRVSLSKWVKKCI